MLQNHSSIALSDPGLLTQCRCCLSEDLFCFLPLGLHAPANMFIRPEEASEPHPAFPLDAQVCLSCGLVQVADQIPAGFFEHYLYVPSGASTMHTHFKGLAEALEARAKGGLIVDVGCNDGLMLAAANAQGSKTLGIDPAANIAELSRERGVEVVVDYFTPETAARLAKERGKAAVISTTNTFNHIGDLHDFMRAVDVLLEPEGTFVIEVPWGLEILEGNQFDNIYHEHVSELSLLSVRKLVQHFDMDIVDVEHMPVHGGTMRVYVRRTACGEAPSARVVFMLEREDAAGMTDRATWIAFADRVHDIRERLLAALDLIKSEGLKVAGYGAPAKGNTLLTYFGIGPDRVDFLVDRNPLKQNMLAPNTGIPVKSPEAIKTEKPDVLLVLAWNFLDEILEQQADFAAAGGRFLVPLPDVRMI
ncbi:bifunctional 3-demethylubiquinone-9 3-methyltransferase/ 2-octaprenyl-6-hydroxy phenol methylase [Rhodobacteraceae bacterium THAF1]|uniref:class I SAM-dependent methyltransferase n=1 Tax=Palleronia sp. THAF1 TaxID=2587842 RepID=UPI000F410B7F|nr:class I SAM-dependent methyltransferase [Palleronia sp. THAF1]QFU10324.1 bifunctional 3-demethylubiquinone-9 3-methyltransferase/ 2-octaprenyl-6-hydroxy phenol methylase [Palleronia sp. THAF1]VDC31442.1 bifunctional 3-demethylubiquinone-9 3-methyltransferase/ 2-octaprenyl-6-hydroxy phenol methylase [Rhodobacteraceae bacterium THAF1]